MNSAIIMHYTWEKVNAKGFTWNRGRAIILSDLTGACRNGVGVNKKQSWVNCNSTGLFVLDNSCNGGIVVQSCSVDFPPAFNTPPTNGCMYGRKEDSWQNCPPLKGPVKWNIWPWSRSCTHTIYRSPPSSADTVPLRLSFSI